MFQPICLLGPLRLFIFDRFNLPFKSKSKKRLLLKIKISSWMKSCKWFLLKSPILFFRFFCNHSSWNNFLGRYLLHSSAPQCTSALIPQVSVTVLFYGTPTFIWTPMFILLTLTFPPLRLLKTLCYFFHPEFPIPAFIRGIFCFL